MDTINMHEVNYTTSTQKSTQSNWPRTVDQEQVPINLLACYPYTPANRSDAPALARTNFI